MPNRVERLMIEMSWQVVAWRDALRVYAGTETAPPLPEDGLDTVVEIDEAYGEGNDNNEQP